MRVSPKGVEASKKVVGKGRHLTVNTLSISAYSLLPSFTKFCPIIMRSFSVPTHLDTYQKKKNRYSIYKDVSMNISYYS